MSTSSSEIPSDSSSSSATPSESSVSVDVCDDGKRRIQLTPTFQKRFIINNTDGFRLRVEVTDVCGMTDKIFRHYRYPTSQLYGDAETEFTGVCSWPDLLEFPEDEPREEDSPQVFRLNYFDVVVRTEALAYETWELIQQEVAALVQTINEGDELEAGEPVWLGAAP